MVATGAVVNKAESNGATSLMFAAQNGHAEVVRALLAAGADVNAANKNGVTALMASNQNGHAEVVHTLVTAGAGQRRGQNRLR